MIKITQRMARVLPLVLCGMLFAQKVNKATLDADVAKLRDPKNTANDIYRILGNLKISTFSSDKLFKDGLAEEELVKWRSYTLPANVFAAEEDPSIAPTINEISNAFNFIVSTVKSINNAYGKAFDFFDAYKTKEWVFNFDKVSIDSIDVQRLKEIRSEAAQKLDQMTQIVNRTLAKMSQDATYPESWARSVPEKLEVIYPTYKEFYADWVKARSIIEGDMTNEEFNLFLRQQGIKNVKDASSLLAKLEKLQYRLEQKGSKYFARKEKKIAAAIQEIIAHMKLLYPEMPLSSLASIRLANTSDKVSTIILGEADAMQGALKRIVIEIDALIKAVTK